MGHSYSNIYKIPITMMRFFTVYGEYGRPDMALFKFTKAIMEDKNIDLYNNGKHFRDFTYVKDTASGIALASVAKNVTGTYNISRGKKEKILDVANTIVKLVGKGTVKVRDKKITMPSRGTLDCTSAMMAFKFNPKIDIQEGLKNYYDWVKDSVYWSKKTV